MPVSISPEIPLERTLNTPITGQCDNVRRDWTIWVLITRLSIVITLVALTAQAQTDSGRVVAPVVDTLQIAAPPESLPTTTMVDSLPVTKAVQPSSLVDIMTGNKKIRATGWGEYRVKGRCLCCDNTNDGDCIVVHNIESSEKRRLPQIHDGQSDGDPNDTTTYFGNVMQREHPTPATFLLVEISLGKMYEIQKVIVSTMINRTKRVNFLSNCEFGYYDQFGRLQWTGKVESKKFDEPITFDMDKPVFTKQVMLRVKGGKSRITEVAIFSRSQTDEKQ